MIKADGVEEEAGAASFSAADHFSAIKAVAELFFVFSVDRRVTSAVGAVAAAVVDAYAFALVIAILELYQLGSRSWRRKGPGLVATSAEGEEQGEEVQVTKHRVSAGSWISRRFRVNSGQ